MTIITMGDEVQSARNADNPLKLLFSFKDLQSLVFDVQKDFFKASIGSDAVVYHPGAAIGYFAARQLNIPSILATPFPMTPTREYPSLIFYDRLRLGKRANVLTHKLFEQIIWFASRSPIQKFWQQEFGQAPKDLKCPYPKQITQRMPTVISCSNYVFPRPKDWPEHVYNCGYCKKLSAQKLAQALDYALQPEIKAAATALGDKIQSEYGAEAAAKIIISCIRTKQQPVQ